MLNERVIVALNLQAQHEKTNSYIYRSFSGIADGISLTGAASWFYQQAKEEENHFEEVLTYIQNQNYVPHLLPIPEQIPQPFALYDLFVEALRVEQETTVMLKNLCQICKEENDDQTYKFAMELLYEQIEEEKSVSDILNRIRMAGADRKSVV